MFEKATNLQLALLYRGMNTERNLVQKYLDKDPDNKGWKEQIEAIQFILDEIDIAALSYSRFGEKENPDG